MLRVCKYGFYRDQKKTKSRHVEGASFQVSSFILQKKMYLFGKDLKV